MYSLHPSIQDPLGNLRNADMQGLFWFFLRSDASGISAAVIHGMHASGVKHMQRVIKFAINADYFFPKKN